jgi:hypothetical protein
VKGSHESSYQHKEDGARAQDGASHQHDLQYIQRFSQWVQQLLTHRVVAVNSPILFPSVHTNLYVSYWCNLIKLSTQTQTDLIIILSSLFLHWKDLKLELLKQCKLKKKVVSY